MTTRDDFSDLADLLTDAQATADREFASRLDPEVVAAAEKARKRRRRAALTVTLLVAAIVGTYIPVILLAPLGNATLTIVEPVITPPAAVELALPAVGVSAISITGAEQFEGTIGTGGILAASSAEARPIASVTKLVAALVILGAVPLEVGQPGPTLTFSEADEDLYDKYYVLGATILPMEEGSTMALSDALEMMLVTSATNYAAAVANWAFGSEAGFREATSAWLAAQGLTGTTIVEPTGIDAGNISTPSDLIVLGRMAMANPVIAAIVGSKALDVNGFAAERNTNTLIGHDGVNGIKTGTLDEAGSCLLFSAVVGVGGGITITAIGVVLGGANRDSVNREVSALLASVKSGFHDVMAVPKNDGFGTVTTAWGEESRIVAADNGTVFTWSDLPIAMTVETTPLAIGSKGDSVGTATIVAGEESDSVPLVLHSTIEGPDAWWRLTHPFQVLGF